MLLARASYRLLAPPGTTPNVHRHRRGRQLKRWHLMRRWAWYATPTWRTPDAAPGAGQHVGPVHQADVTHLLDAVRLLPIIGASVAHDYCSTV